MKLNFKCLPIGSLPYTDYKLCKQMILSLFESIPYLPELTLKNPKDNTFDKTLENMPCLKGNVKGLKLGIELDNIPPQLSIIDKIYNTDGYEGIERFSSSSEFMHTYLAMLNRIKPKETVIKIYGPFSIMQKIQNIDISDLLNEQVYRKYFVQTFTLKAIWFIKQIKEASPGTTPIIIFEEPLLHKFGALKRENNGIQKENITTLYQKIFQKIHLADGYVGVECFEKCNWQLVIDAGVNLISFDAYNNPTSLSIITESINNFLISGGYINWAFVPVTNENTVKNLKLDVLVDKLIIAMSELACDGVHSELLFRHSTVSVLGNMHHLPILFAEKALILAKQLSQKIPKSYAPIQQNPQ